MPRQEPAAPADVPKWMKLSRWRRLLPLLVVLALAAAVYLVWHEVRPYGLAGMLQAITAIPRDRLALAALFALASYATLTLFDWLGLRYAEHPLPYPKAALASFVALSIGHTLGLAPLGSGALRARYYTQWGLDAEAIGKVILYCAATVTIGEVALAVLVLLIAPHPAASWVHVEDNAVRLVGIGCAVAIACYLAAAHWLRRPLKIGRWRIALPTLPLAMAQVAVGAVNFALLTATLHFLVSAGQPVPFWTMAAIFLLANVAALISHVPGGLGVTEFVVLAFLPSAGTWAALIVFRIVYYAVPLALGGIVLGVSELLERRSAPPRPAAATNGPR
jgi:glycosyltransferase 2 family protein